MQLGTVFQNFFAGRARYPKFRKKGLHDRFSLSHSVLSVNATHIRIPRLGWVHMWLRFAGKIMSATVSRVADKWYASITVEVPDYTPRTKAENQGEVGVDLGVSALATLSNGEKIPGPKALKASLRKLKRLSRGLSRKVKGSKNRHKAGMKVARLHARISNIRQDGLHQLTTSLTRRFHTIGIEDLNVQSMVKKDMVKNRHLARSIADMGFFEFRRQLEYKARWRGALVVVADKWFASSKTCLHCAYKLKRLSRGLIRKVKGSQNRHKARLKVARLHARISNIRQDGLHQLTTSLTCRFHTIGIEDLNVKGMVKKDMVKNRHLARAIADMGFFEFRRQLDYKARQRGGMVVVADKWFASSKTCLHCAYKLKRLSRGLSRKVKGSKNRHKAGMKVARLHARISNIRQDGLHQLTTSLTRRFHTIGIEDLNVQSMVKKDMVKNRHLARSIADMGFFEFRRQLEYKARWRGALVVVADKWFASSKTCSHCAYKLESLSLAAREWTCPSCNRMHERDVNAAINLKNMAVGSTVSVCGEHRALARLARIE